MKSPCTIAATIPDSVQLTPAVLRKVIEREAGAEGCAGLMSVTISPKHLADLGAKSGDKIAFDGDPELISPHPRPLKVGLFTKLQFQLPVSWTTGL